MTTTAAGTTAAQPSQPEASPTGGAEGAQSQGTSGPDLYQEVLNAIPEQLRGDVEPHLKKWSSGVNERFMEAAEFRKTWEPYQELGLTDFQPEQVSELLKFAQFAQDEERFNDWLLREAEARELLEPDELPGGGPEGEPGDAGGLTLDGIKEVFSSMLDERLGPIQERFSSMDEQERISEAGKAIDTKLSELKTQHGKGMSDEEWGAVQQRVLKLALSHVDEKTGLLSPESIDRAFADYQEIVSGAEQGLFRQKAEQPSTPERGGRPATAAEPITSFAEASKAALEMARQSP